MNQTDPTQKEKFTFARTTVGWKVRGPSGFENQTVTVSKKDGSTKKLYLEKERKDNLMNSVYFFSEPPVGSSTAEKKTEIVESQKEEEEKENNNEKEEEEETIKVRYDGEGWPTLTIFPQGEDMNYLVNDLIPSKKISGMYKRTYPEEYIELDLPREQMKEIILKYRERKEEARKEYLEEKKKEGEEEREHERRCRQCGSRDGLCRPGDCVNAEED